MTFQIKTCLFVGFAILAVLIAFVVPTQSASQRPSSAISFDDHVEIRDATGVSLLFAPELPPVASVEADAVITYSGKLFTYSGHMTNRNDGEWSDVGDTSSGAMIPPKDFNWKTPPGVTVQVPRGLDISKTLQVPNSFFQPESWAYVITKSDESAIIIASDRSSAEHIWMPNTRAVIYPWPLNDRFP